MRKLELLLKFSQLDAISKKEEEEEEEEFEAFSLHYFPKLLLINILIVNRKKERYHESDRAITSATVNFSLSISYFKAKKNERRERERQRDLRLRTKTKVQLAFILRKSYSS